MKTLKFTCIALFAVLFTFSGCKKDEPQPKQAITNDQAAQVIEASISSMYGGFGLQISHAVSMANIANAGPCGVLEDSTFKVSFTGSPITYTYELDYRYEVICDANNNHTAVKLDYDSKGLFDSPHLTCTDSCAGSWMLTGLDKSSSDYTLNGYCKRTGSYLYKGNSGNLSFDGSVEVASDNLKVNKFTKTIISGKGLIKLNGKTSAGQSYSYYSQIEFQGGHKATVDINGKIYTIQWN